VWQAVSSALPSRSPHCARPRRRRPSSAGRTPRIIARSKSGFADASVSSTAPGTTCGNHRANSPRHPRASPGMVSAVQMHGPARGAGRIPCRIPPYKREAGGSNPPAPTRFVQLDGLFEKANRRPGNHAGNHRCMLPDAGRVTSGPGSIPMTTRTRPCAAGRHRRDWAGELPHGQTIGWRVIAAQIAPRDRRGPR